MTLCSAQTASSACPYRGLELVGTVEAAVPAPGGSLGSKNRLFHPLKKKAIAASVPLGHAEARGIADIERGDAVPPTPTTETSRGRTPTRRRRALPASVGAALILSVVLAPPAAAVDTDMAISTTAIDFGTVSVGATAQSAVQLTNTGGDPFGPINMFGGAPPTAGGPARHHPAPGAPGGRYGRSAWERRRFPELSGWE